MIQTKIKVGDKVLVERVTEPAREYIVKTVFSNGVVVNTDDPEGMFVRFEEILSVSEGSWEVKRCPSCYAILFELDGETFTKGSVRFKCRKCKNVTIV